MKEMGGRDAGASATTDVSASGPAPGKSTLADSAPGNDGVASARGGAGTGSLFGATPPWSGAGGAARGDGEGSSADNWMPAPRLIAMDAPAERETDIKTTTAQSAIDAPDGRRTVGIGEVVTMRSPTTNMWTAAAHGPGGKEKGNGGVFKWVAPESAGPVTITAASSKKGDAPQTVTFNVIAPEDIAFSKSREATPAEWKNKIVGAGMLTDVNLLPITVSFQHLTWQEIEGGPSSPAGFFTRPTATPPNHIPKRTPLMVEGLTDLAVYYNDIVPNAGGSFDWVIENVLRVRGGKNPTTLTTTQHVELSESPLEGYATVSKRGQTTPAAVSATVGPRGARLKKSEAGGGGALGCGNDGKTVMVDVIGKIPVPGEPGKAPDEDDDPNKVPKEFTRLPRELIAMLYASRGHLDHFVKHPEWKFWTAMHEMSVADLHTFVQVHKGTMAAGLWPLIKVIHVVYTYDSSWGVHFIGSPNAIVKNGQWGRDRPQSVVASRHKNGSQYEWYRQNSGAGNPGLHMGLDKGAGHHDVHVDPTNPMERVGTGEVEIAWNPLGPPFPIVHPKGDAVYAAGETLKHMAEVGINLPSKNADATRDILADYYLDETRKHARNYVNLESDPATQARTTNTARSMACVANLNSQMTVADEITAQMRQLAMMDDKEAAPLRDLLKPRIQQTRNRLIDRMVELFQHMKAETPNVDAKGYDTHAGWKENTHGAYDTCKALAEARQKKF